MLTYVLIICFGYLLFTISENAFTTKLAPAPTLQKIIIGYPKRETCIDKQTIE